MRIKDRHGRDCWLTGIKHVTPQTDGSYWVGSDGPGASVTAEEARRVIDLLEAQTPKPATRSTWVGWRS